MERVVSLCFLTFIWVIGAFAALAQTGPGRTCAFSVVGMWKVEGRIEADFDFYSFSPDGWVRIVSHSADALPREYEIIAEVRYILDSPATPRRIEFISRRGNEAFPAGKTSLDIVEYSDESFTTVDPKTRNQMRWVRVETQKYFLTLAARRGPAPSAFAMWTTLDGRRARIEALGLRLENQGGSVPIFGAIPAKLYHEFENESRKATDTMLRLELTEAEFYRSHEVFETWNEYVKTAKLPHDDPYVNGMEFLKSAAENLNQCDKKLKLQTGGVTITENPHQQIFDYIETMRKKNNSLHITDGMFPVDWRPMLLPNN